jgi:hypothetical protein
MPFRFVNIRLWWDKLTEMKTLAYETAVVIASVKVLKERLQVVLYSCYEYFFWSIKVKKIVFKFVIKNSKIFHETRSRCYKTSFFIGGKIMLECLFSAYQKANLIFKACSLRWATAFITNFKQDCSNLTV